MSANLKPLFSNAPILDRFPEPANSAVITVMADKLKKKNAIVKNRKFIVKPTAATAAGDIQLVAMVVTVAKLISHRKVKTKGPPNRKSSIACPTR